MCQTNRCWCFVLVAAPLLAGSAPALQAQESARGQELRRLLNQPIQYPGVDDPKATLTDVLDQLAKRYNLAFDINEHAFKDADIKDVNRLEIATPVPVPEMHTRVGTVLKKILLRVSPSTTYIIRDDFIEITTMKAIRKEFFADRPSGPLPPLVSVSFDNETLGTACKQLAHAGNSIVLDARVAKDALTPVSADFVNVPQDTAVRLLADMAGLKMVPLDNVLYVTSVETASVLQEEQEARRLKRQSAKKESMDKTKKANKPGEIPTPAKAKGASGK